MNDEVKKSINHGKGIEAGNLVMPAAAVFADDELSSEVSSFLSGIFNHNSDKYDTAIDAAYNSQGVGSSATHHIVDGSHTIAGSYHAAGGVSDTDSAFTAAKESFEHLMRDFTTESGINPLFTVNPDTLEKTKDFLEGSAGVSRSWVNDMLTMNAFEAAGAAVAAAGAVYGFKKQDYHFTGRLVGSGSWASIVGGNPLLSAVVAITAAKAWRDANSGQKEELSKGIVRGGILTGIATTVAAAVGGPAIVGIAAGVYAAHVAATKMDGKKCNDIVTRTLKRTASAGAMTALKLTTSTLRGVLKRI